jgi:hypothetical protein
MKSPAINKINAAQIDRRNVIELSTTFPCRSANRTGSRSRVRAYGHPLRSESMTIS